VFKDFFVLVISLDKEYRLSLVCLR